MLGRFTTRKNFEDGSVLKELHRYALRYESKERSIDIGFEQALEPDVDRLVHLETIHRWNSPHDQQPLTSDERKDILSKIKAYCEEKRLTYRLIGSLDVPDAPSMPLC